jgi:hypothetical protein
MDSRVTSDNRYFDNNLVTYCLLYIQLSRIFNTFLFLSKPYHKNESQVDIIDTSIACA